MHLRITLILYSFSVMDIIWDNMFNHKPTICDVEVTVQFPIEKQITIILLNYK